MHTRPSFLQQRIKPAMALLLALAIVGFNAYLILSSGIVFPWMLAFGTGLATAALFGVVVGEPIDAYHQRPKWFHLSIIACSIAGGLAGLLVSLG